MKKGSKVILPDDNENVVYTVVSDVWDVCGTDCVDIIPENRTLDCGGLYSIESLKLIGEQNG